MVATWPRRPDLCGAAPARRRRHRRADRALLRPCPCAGEPHRQPAGSGSGLGARHQPGARPFPRFPSWRHGAGSRSPDGRGDRTHRRLWRGLLRRHDLARPALHAHLSLQLANQRRRCRARRCGCAAGARIDLRRWIAGAWCRLVLDQRQHDLVDDVIGASPGDGKRQQQHSHDHDDVTSIHRGGTVRLSGGFKIMTSADNKNTPAPEPRRAAVSYT